MIRVVDEKRNYVVKGALLVALAEVIQELKLMSEDDKKFNNDRLLYKLGVLHGLFDNEDCFSEIEEK